MKRFACILLLIAASCYRSGVEDPLVAIQIQDRNGLTETVSSPDRLATYGAIDFLSSQPYKKILRVYKQNGKSHSKITTYHPNGHVWQYLEAEELRAHGAYREWHPNGQLKLEAKVIGGTADVTAGTQWDWLFDGISQVWDDQGRLLATIPYRQGILEGKSVYYYPSNQIEKELTYRANLQEGESAEYYRSGKLRSKTSYQQGEKQGLSLGYFEDGQSTWIEEFREGLLLQGAYYDPKGKQLAEVVDGMGFQAILTGDVLTELVQIFQGMAEGGVKQFAPNGEVQGTYHIKNGMKHGEETAYYLSHEQSNKKTDLLLKLSMNWDRNAIQGPVKTWYNNGQLQSQRDYARNKRNGASLAWYREGSLMMIEEYEDDRLIKGQYYKKNGQDPVSTIFNGNGIATLYDENGIFIRKITYAKSDPVDPEN
jgi:antitoxin component YwqK of YwqJK toxin-antitoxin module